MSPNSLKPEINVSVISVLFLSGFFTGISWFGIASIFPFIAPDLGVGISELGLMSASFLAGVGLSQIPSGIFSARMGPKQSMILGAFISASSILACAIIHDANLLIALRFSVGIGTAFVFTPGISLVARHFPFDREGFGIGLFDASSLVGAVAGLLGNAILATYLGWRITLVGNGVVGLAIALALIFIIPKEIARSDFRIRASSVKRILLDKWLIAFGLSLLGLEIAIALEGNFMVFYLTSGLGEGAIISGLVTSLLPIFGIFPTIFFGRLSIRMENIRRLVLLMGFLTASSLAIISFSTLISSVVSTILVGFFQSAGFILCINASRQQSNREQEYESLAISWAITLSLVGSFFAPVFFSYAVLLYGYEFAWIACSLLSIGFFVPLVLLKTKLANQQSIDPTQ